MDVRRNYQGRGSGVFTFFAAVGVFILTVALFVGIFFWYGKAYTRVSLEITYYFLVRDCEETTAAAVSGQTYLAGGAGYLYQTEGETVVILSCYFTFSDAENVRCRLLEKDVETRVLTLAFEEFTLDGEEMAEESVIISSLKTVETCARILYDTANGLERAALSQEEARTAVKGVYASLKGLQGSTDSFYERWNAALYECSSRAAEIAEGIVFAKDLRYLQTELCLNVINSGIYFL